MVDTMNDTVEVTQPVSVQDDAAQEQATPNALEQFMADTEPTAQATADEQPQETQAQEQQAQEAPEETLPKGIRGRIQAAQAKADRSGYERGRQEADAAYRAKIAEYEEKLAKYSDMEVTMEAQELSRKEHISLDLAKRVIRAEKGIANQVAPQAQQEATGNEIQLNTDMLRGQYEGIKNAYNIDLLEEGMMTEEELYAVTSGKADFNAVLLHMMARRGPDFKTNPQRATPPPVKASVPTQSTYDFMSMSDEEFDRFNAKIGSGHPFKPR